jgi:hypothetical protein
MRSQPYYNASNWGDFHSWLTKTVRSAQPVDLQDSLENNREHKRMQVQDWFKALVTDESIETSKIDTQWKPFGKFFNNGNFRELRTELALLALKAEGKIKDFFPTRTNGAHDAIGADSWIELPPKGFFRRVMPLQTKSSQNAASSFKKMQIHYSDQLQTMLKAIDPKLVDDFDSMGFDGHTKRSIPVVIAKNKSITDLKADIMKRVKEVTSSKKLIHTPQDFADNEKNNARPEQQNRPQLLRTLFKAQLLEAKPLEEAA